MRGHEDKLAMCQAECDIYNGAEPHAPYAPMSPCPLCKGKARVLVPQFARIYGDYVAAMRPCRCTIYSYGNRNLNDDVPWQFRD